MSENIKIGVIGGDLRQLVAAQELAESGYETAVYGFDCYEGGFGMATRCVSLCDAVRKSDFIVLPLPYSLDGIHLNTPLSQSAIHIDELFCMLEPEQIILAGKTGGKQINNIKMIKVIDYYEREDLTILNALPIGSIEGGYTENIDKMQYFKRIQKHTVKYNSCIVKRKTKIA